MKMRGMQAKDFFHWKPYLRCGGDFKSMGYTPTRDNARAVKHVIDQQIRSFTRGELMRVSSIIIRMSRDKQNAHHVKKWKDYYEQEYTTAAVTVAA